MPFKNLNPTYATWVHMRQRCNNPNSKPFPNYGGRGIRVCERWNSYANFVADMGERPSGMSIDRIDVDGDYSPENCVWATQKEQMRNQRVTRRVTIEGVTYVAKDLAERTGFKTDTIVARAKTCKTLAEVISRDKRVYTAGLALGGIANGARVKAKTHCPQGHEYTNENTRISPSGWRVCRACKREKQRARTARLKANA